MTSSVAVEDRCHYCHVAAVETTIVGWAGSCGWVFDACWPCALRQVRRMTGWVL